jgi:hypothetical protein
MTRSVSTVHRATFTCDWCGAMVQIELDPVEYEQAMYVTGHDEVPEGWVKGRSSSGRPRTSDDIPDIYFDSVEHFNLWKERRVKEFAEGVVLL